MKKRAFSRECSGEPKGFGNKSGACCIQQSIELNCFNLGIDAGKQTWTKELKMCARLSTVHGMKSRLCIALPVGHLLGCDIFSFLAHEAHINNLKSEPVSGFSWVLPDAPICTVCFEIGMTPEVRR